MPPRQNHSDSCWDNLHFFVHDRRRVCDGQKRDGNSIFVGRSPTIDRLCLAVLRNVFFSWYGAGKVDLDCTLDRQCFVCFENGLWLFQDSQPIEVASKSSIRCDGQLNGSIAMLSLFTA